MTNFPSSRACPSSRQPPAGIARIAGFSSLLFWLPLVGCEGVEPEEIDLNFADEGGSMTGETSDQDEAGTDGGTTGSSETTGDGGDGDGDGDGDATGDGDGDPPCDALTPAEVVAGMNPIEVPDGPSLLEGTCGGGGPEARYFYTATADGVVQFTLSNATFEGAVYLTDQSCEELDCEPAPQILDFDMTDGQTVYILIDSFTVGGVGSLEIAPI
jgi:hypothetical protein